MALGTDEHAVRVNAVRFNGHEVSVAVISDLDLNDGGILQFVMEVGGGAFGIQYFH